MEPKRYKMISYNQLSPDEVSKSNYPIEKLTFWDITASIPGKTAVDAPHISVYWYGPNVSSDRGRVIRLRGIKLDAGYTDPIKQVVASGVGGTVSEKEGATEFRDYRMKINYAAIADLARAIQDSARLATETTLEFGLVTKEEKAAATLPKTKILGEKPLQE